MYLVRFLLLDFRVEFQQKLTYNGHILVVFLSVENEQGRNSVKELEKRGNTEM